MTARAAALFSMNRRLQSTNILLFKYYFRPGAHVAAPPSRPSSSGTSSALTLVGYGTARVVPKAAPFRQRHKSQRGGGYKWNIGSARCSVCVLSASALAQRFGQPPFLCSPGILISCPFVPLRKDPLFQEERERCMGIVPANRYYFPCILYTMCVLFKNPK